MKLQQRAYRSMGWSGLSGVWSNSLELLKYIVLARLLDPGDFGLLAMAMVIVNICRIFSDGGTSNAVIYYQRQTNRQLSTLFWVNIMASSALYVVIMLTAPFIAAFYNEPEVSRLLRLAGIILPVYAAGALYEVLLRKELSFKKITIAESISALLGFITAILLAINGWGVYSLLWSSITTTGTLTILYAANGSVLWRPSFQFKFGEVRSHLGFGLFQMGERGLSVYTSQIDHLIIGRFFGPEILGAYHIAYKIILFPLFRLAPILNRVAFPVFSSRQDDDAALRNGYLKLISGMTSLMTPFFLLTGISAPWLVPLFFGSGWDLTIQLIPLMAIIGCIRMLGNPCGNVLLSKGKARLSFFWILFTAVVSTAIFFIGAHYSVFVLLQLYAAINLCYFFIGQWLLVNRVIALTWTRFLQCVMPIFLTLLFPSLAVWFFRNIAVGIWNPIAILNGSWNLKDGPANLMQAWQHTEIWVENAPWGEAGMVLSIAVLFIILYLPLLWKFQSGLFREFYLALQSRDTHTC